ncbi:MAG TPA: O-antigen ligase family protein [Pyrinomonadaceae bacterium]|nr:O-antigen ligase family protein [Pyrinomonadaceae bacterium]
MTTSISNASVEVLTHETAAQIEPALEQSRAEPVHTLASRFIFLVLCLAIVLSTLAYGTVHYWSLAVFQAGAALIILLWAIDAWRSGDLRVSRNPLQWPLLGLLIIGLVQLLPFGGTSGAGALSVEPVRTLSLDPYSTRLTLVRLFALFIYFAAALVFTDSSHRLRLLVRTIIIFGFLLAILGLIQSFTRPTKVYWLRELQQSTPFGPFINRHHFAGYMELTMALPLGLLFSGAVEREKSFIYIFAAGMMGIALIMTNSRGGIISLFAEAAFLVAVTGFRRKHGRHHATQKHGRMRGALVRAGLGLSLVLAILIGVILLGGEAALSRFVGTVNAEDPTTGRAHYWSVTLDIIRNHPLIGTGLGAYGVVYTRYDSRNGLFRLEQAHNDYLQVIADAGLLGAALGLLFLVALFRLGSARLETEDRFRRGVATGALAGCFAVLVHSFFDFTLHTTSNALLFLILAALATLNGRVERAEQKRRRRKRHRRRSSTPLSGIYKQVQESAVLPVKK